MFQGSTTRKVLVIPDEKHSMCLPSDLLLTAPENAETSICLCCYQTEYFTNAFKSGETCMYKYHNEP